MLRQSVEGGMQKSLRILPLLAALLLVHLLPALAADDHWVASWATSPAAYFVYVPPVPPAYPPGYPAAFAPATIQPDLGFPFPDANKNQASQQTIRSIVKPDLWGNRMRFRFSNAFGTQPLSFDAVTVALQDYSGNVVQGTITPVIFDGKRTVTIPPGEEIWSDGVKLPWISAADDPRVQGRNLAVSYSVLGNSGPMTYHAASNTTSYITAPGSGDHTADPDVFAYKFTTTSWFFLDAVDVMARADTVVICAFGDSITDGTHTTLNENDRWSNALSRRLHNAYGNRVSIVNEAIGGNRVANPVATNATAGPAAVDRLDRDVLGLSGLTHVIWLEGINDLGAGHSADAVIAGYQDVVARLHAKGIKVFAGTLTSARGMANPAAGWNTDVALSHDNGPIVDDSRKLINAFIRSSGLFDGVEDFDAATFDVATGNMKAEFVPDSQMTQLPWDYLHPNHAGYLAMAAVVDIAPFRPRSGRKSRGK
jgi:lysophospholipase L1-like esterase